MMFGRKKKVKNRFIEDDPDSLVFSSSEITEEDKEWAERQFKELEGSDQNTK